MALQVPRPGRAGLLDSLFAERTRPSEPATEHVDLTHASQGTDAHARRFGRGTREGLFVGGHGGLPILRDPEDAAQQDLQLAATGGIGLPELVDALPAGRHGAAILAGEIRRTRGPMQELDVVDVGGPVVRGHVPQRECLLVLAQGDVEGQAGHGRIAGPDRGRQGSRVTSLAPVMRQLDEL